MGGHKQRTSLPLRSRRRKRWSVVRQRTKSGMGGLGNRRHVMPVRSPIKSPITVHARQAALPRTVRFDGRSERNREITMDNQQNAIPAARSRTRKVDGRSSAARRFKRLCAAFAADLGAAPTSAQTELIRQAATLVVRATQIQDGVLAGEDINDDDLVRITNSAVRALSALGLQRKRAVRAPDLRSYLESKSK